MRQAIERFLIESTPASRCLAGVVAAFPLMGMVVGLFGMGLGSAEIRQGLRTDLLWALEGLLLASMAILAGIARWLWLRRHESTPRPGIELAVALLIGLPFSMINCISGLYSAGPTLSLLGAMIGGLLLLQWRVMIIGIICCAITLVSFDLMMWKGALPYTIVITSHAFVDGQPQWWWRDWQGLILYIGLPLTVTLVLMLFGSHDAVRHRLARLAITDPLTGLANRRHFMERLQQELARQRRNDRPLTVVSLDADRFKRINDEHGHAKGDEVLVALATIMLIGVRSPTDLVARLGGEEFALLLPDTPLSEAEVVCKRLQALLAAHRFESASGQEFVVTMSMGMTQCQGVDVVQVLQEIDTNLYTAKAAGRDRIVCSVLERPAPARWRA